MQKKLIVPDIVKLIDVPTITVKESELIANAMLRIARGDRWGAEEEIKDFRGYEGVFIWKPSHEIRNTCGMEVRCVYFETKDTIEIVAATGRDTVYRVANERLRKYQRLQDRWLSKDNG